MSPLYDHYPSQSPPPSLKICCFGSSSESMPIHYLNEAYNLGCILARRNHTCVNVGGLSGCIASINKGASDEDGEIIEIMHQKVVPDNKNWVAYVDGKQQIYKQGKTKILVAGHNDWQERKRLLMKNSEAVIFLPGGPGTWDELWEIVCAKNEGLTILPVVCINVRGYYDPFLSILKRAYDDNMMKLKPEEVLKIVNGSEEAVKWIEDQCTSFDDISIQCKLLKKPSLLMRRGSMIGPPIGFEPPSLFLKDQKEAELIHIRKEKNSRENSKKDILSQKSAAFSAATHSFAIGMVVGIFFTMLPAYLVLL